jgi:ribosomal protein S18 acetylase RimI-like enzyme
VRIERATRATEALLSAMRRLVPQLNPASEAPTLEHLETLIGSSAVELLLARDGSGEIVGMLTLARYPIPTGTHVRIEDVVVDEAARGGGVGEALVRAALRRARELGARSVDLTSRPDREAANRLYLRLGFQRRETNAYRHFLTDR